MPLNPPSYKGQDVYYSTNVYVNKVPVALWKPPEPGDAAIFSVSLPPDPLQAPFTAEQQTLISQSQAAANQSPFVGVIAVGPNSGQQITTAQGDLPAPGATGESFEGKQSTTTASVPIPAGKTPFDQLDFNLQTCLYEAVMQGKWKRTGSNPNILACFTDMGSPQPSDATPWCAAFAGAMLKRSGLPYRQGNLRALGYNGYGKPIPVASYDQFRKNDVIVMTKSYNGQLQSHVGFIQAVDPQRKAMLCLGGNQGSDVNVCFWEPLSSLVYIGRQWDLPDAYDVPIIKSPLPRGGPVNPPTR